MAPANEGSGPHLRLVCINDVYSLANLPRFAGLVQHVRSHDPADALLVTLAGDFVAPSLLSSLDLGRGMVDTLNAAGVTHVIFGNHEDDVPIAALRERVREFQGVWLDTNMPAFDPPLPRSEVRTVTAPGKRSVRVGLVGVVMNDPAVYCRPPFGGTPVLPANATALEETHRLVHDERCACVVALTHQSAPDDRALALLQRDPPFPVILGGHEHGVITEQIDRTLLSKSGMDAEFARVIDLRWPALAPTEGHDLPAVTHTLERVKDYPEDPHVAAVVARHQQRTKDLQEATLIPLAPGRELSSIGTRTRQTSLGTLLCSLMRDALGADACVFNGGGIRASRSYTGRFTYADLEAEMPFENEVVSVTMPGGVLKKALAFSRSRGESGGFLQHDDRMATLDGVELTRIAGTPIDEARAYRVALVRDFLVGLDRIDPLVHFAHEHPERVPPSGSGRGVKLLCIDTLSRMVWDELGGFETMDQDRDGKVKPGEFEAALRATRGGTSAELVATLMFRALDANKDGVVVPSEVRREEGDGGQ